MSSQTNGFRLPAAGVLLLGAAILSACSGSDSPVGCGAADCVEEVEAFPRLLSSLDTMMARGRQYEPRYRLWSNGLVKDRRLVLPDGGQVDTSDRSAWVFPDGTRIFKTFSVTTTTGGGSRPIETRLMVKRNGKWEFGVYLWRADGSDAELQEGRLPVPVALTDAQGRSFTHQVPSPVQCGLCHLTNPTTVIGFSELQLNGPSGGAPTQLESFYQNGVLGGTLPSNPEVVEAPDEATRSVIGYVQGNCRFCHNAQTLAGGVDFSHPVFLQNTVNQPGQVGGILIKPGDPDGSVLYQRFSSGDMPALGVQMGDSAAYEMVREWILTHDFGG